MFGIGQFAQLAKVSVRALRHYDELGLLEPAHVEPESGYRFYTAAQLPELNRILALKDLGFRLSEISQLTEAGVSADQLVGMLRLRQAEAVRDAEIERKRLDRVAARIELLKGASTMNDLATAIVVKPLDRMRVVTASEPVDGFDVEFAPIFERLYFTVYAALEKADVAPTGPNAAFYEERPDGRVEVFAAVPIGASSEIDDDRVEIRTLPAAQRAATLVHTGNMDNCDQSYQILQTWMDAAGETPVGFSREIYLDCAGGRDSWITELQFVLR